MAVKYLIAGATSGVGLAFTKSLSGTDSSLVLVVRDVKKAESLYRDCKFSSLKFIDADLSYPEKMLSKLESLFAEEALPDAILYSAGIDIPMTAKRALFDKCQDIMNVNFMSFVMLMRALLRYKKTSSLTKVLAISSKACHSPIAGNSIYASSKAALETYIRNVSKEVSQTSLNINALAPGWIDSPMAWNSPTALMHEDLDAYLRETTQPEGLIPLDKIVAKIHSYLDEDGLDVTGNIEII